MTRQTSTIATWRNRVRARIGSTLPWARRSDLAAHLEALAATNAQHLDALRAELEGLVALHAGYSSGRIDQFDQQLVRLSDDLTELIGSRMAENAESHELLATRTAEVDATLAALAAHVDVLTRSIAALSDGPSARRKELHDALAWYPTWSALAPLASEPLVSVIVPTRDRRGLLEGALASLVRQTYPNWEAIVVNDGSTDSTGDLLDEICARDQRFRRFDGGGRGCAIARRHGLEQVRGDVIAYLDDDNVMTDGWLRAAVEALGRSPELGAVYGGQLRQEEVSMPTLLLEPFDELVLLESNFIDIGAFAHRPLGGVAFREHTNGFEDWDFILSVNELHSIDPLPVVASVYMTTAPGRMSMASGRYEVESTVRSTAVRRRLADPAFVERSLRLLTKETSPSTGAVITHDAESLVAIMLSIARRRGGTIGVLEWGTRPRLEFVQDLLGPHGMDVHWRVVGSDEPPDVEAPYDVIVVDGEMPRACVATAREVVAADGFVLVHGDDASWRDVDGFESWMAIGDEFWIGSTTATDFTGIVPIRALLRGMRRSR